MKKRNWLIFAICSMCAFGAIACSDDSKSDDNNEENEGDGSATMMVTSSKTMKAGDTESLAVTYKKGEVAADNVKLSVSSDDPACVKPLSDEYTVMEGSAEVKIQAQNVKDDCDAKIWVYDASTGIKKSSAIHVTGNGGGGGGGGEVIIDREPVIQFVEPVGCSGTSSCSFTADVTAASMTATVKYLDKKGNIVPGTSISVSSSDTECVSPKIANIETVDSGDAVSTLVFNGTNCNAAVTFAVGETEATLSITRGEATTYYVNVVANYVNSNSEDASIPGQRIADAQTMMYGTFAGGSCPSDSVMESGNVTLVNGNQVSIAGKSANPIYTKKNFKVDKKKDEVDGKTSFVAIAFDVNDKVIAYGCTPNVTKANYEGKDVPIYVKEIPVQFHQEYTIISNFDFTSGFSKTTHSDGSYPAAEQMQGGDWIQFVVKLFENPVHELLEFVWANTLSRLIGMLGNDGWQGVVKGLVNDQTKQIAILALTPMIEDLLKDQTWYQYTTAISKDVADLASNMQLVGTVTAGSFDDMLISGFKTKFNAVQYTVTDNWHIQGKTISCIPEGPTAYVAEGVCRHNLSLDEGAVSSDWSGKVKFTPTNTSLDADAYLDINKASLEFKWGQVLYAAVFGDILPIVFNYKVESKNGQKLYLKSFLGAIAFKPVVDYYIANKQGKKVGNDQTNSGDVDSSTVYPTITIPQVNSSTGADQSCNRFIEALVYMVWPTINDSLSTFGSAVITTVADFACTQGMGELDKLVMDQIDKLTLSTTNGVTLSSTDCTLFVKDNFYEKMGEPDSSHISANTFLTNEGVANTKRCIWNLDAGNNVVIKGLFHAIENDL